MLHTIFIRTSNILLTLHVHLILSFFCTYITYNIKFHPGFFHLSKSSFSSTYVAYNLKFILLPVVFLRLLLWIKFFPLHTHVLHITSNFILNFSISLILLSSPACTAYNLKSSLLPVVSLPLLTCIQFFLLPTHVLDITTNFHYCYRSFSDLMFVLHSKVNITTLLG